MRRLRRFKTSLYRFWYGRVSRTEWKVVRFRGAEFVVRPTNYIDRRMWIEGGYEPEQIDYLLTCARQRSFDVFIDIGSNFGLYSIVLGVNRAASDVHAFECDPRSLAHLTAHMRMNGLLDLVTVHPIAASDAEGSVTFAMAVDTTTGQSKVVPSSGASGLRASAGSKASRGQVVTVDAQRVDRILDYRGKSVLIKIDVEGYERNVLRGLDGILRNNVCLVQVEVLEDDASLADELGKLGYREMHRLGNGRFLTNA